MNFGKPKIEIRHLKMSSIVLSGTGKFGAGIGLGLCKRHGYLELAGSSVFCRNYNNATHSEGESNGNTGHVLKKELNKQRLTAFANMNPNIVKYGVPIVLVISTLLFLTKNQNLDTKEIATVKEDLIETATKSIDNSILTSNHVHIGSYSFNQRDVEEAFIANPDQFIQDILHISTNLDTMSESDQSAKYRSLCLFARNILLVDSACSSDVLKIARIHFEKAIKAEKETIIYKFVSFSYSIKHAILNVLRSFGGFIGGHISWIATGLKDHLALFFQDMNLFN